MVIVSHAHRFIFLKSKKTAGTSMEIALSRVCGLDNIITPISLADEQLRRALGGRPPQHYTVPPLEWRSQPHLSASEVREIVGPDLWGSYFKFSIEQNPWDAVISLYYWRNRHVPRLSLSRTSSTRTKCRDGQTGKRGSIDCTAKSPSTRCVASNRWRATWRPCGLRSASRAHPSYLTRKII